MVKIMVVDKNPLTGQAFEHVMKKNRPDISYVGQAFAGTKGLELAGQTRPDIVFADILLPGINGLQMAKNLKELYPEIYIVIVTTADNFVLVEKALRIGINDYLLKPLSLKDLLYTVDNLTSIISHSRIEQPPPSNILPECCREFIRILGNGTIEQVMEYSEDVLPTLAAKAEEDPNQIRTYLINISTEIMSSGQNTYMNGPLTIIYKQFLGHIISASETEELFSCFNQFVEKVSALYTRKDNSYRFEIVSQIQKIIESRLDDNITLEGIADEMFFTPSYLSRLFKKEIGQNFSEYLIERRLEKAKVLLLSTNRTIESIAVETGYENANSFRRLFKSKMGMSATKYRSSYNQ